jgi:adenine-specific DNA methylase
MPGTHWIMSWQENEQSSRDETTSLYRWGYTNYRELFNARQLLGLETSCRLISA